MDSISDEYPKVVSLTFDEILRLGYHIGFSDGAGYMINRDYKDDPHGSKFYDPPIKGNIDNRLDSSEEADIRENLYKKLK
jgi:hypothetical protein